MSRELGIPDMHRWRYVALGDCRRCGTSEAPGVRLYRWRDEDLADAMNAPSVCYGCTRELDAIQTADEVLG